MPLSWNEIKRNAIAFSKEWADAVREQAESKSFWDEFFSVFGLRRRHVASFEEPVKNLAGHKGRIDLFWKGMLLAEHKSSGKNLDIAHAQAMDYIQSLQRENRYEEVPRYVIVSDFGNLALHDLESNVSVQFPLEELHNHIHLFGFIPGYTTQSFNAQDPINLKAVEIMGDLHDSLREGGYAGHELERFLVRILFCLFAEDTGIFPRNAFQQFIENHTKPDGSDLGPQLARLFEVLNKPVESRQSNLLEELAELPYVNGDLFAEHLSFADFNREMREQVLKCTKFDWSRISPAVFGALFQSVMDTKSRREIGAHYTSENDILKVIRPLFLDELLQELKELKSNSRKLKSLHDRLAKIRLLDPACGCGNFLVIAYRELRFVELEILKRLYPPGRLGQKFDVAALSRVDVDQMFGIELEEWPARIAEVALWLMDHQLNLLYSETFGNYFVRLPLKKSPHIWQGNSLRLDWNDVLDSSECSFVLGNPPFRGARYQTSDQRREVDEIVASDNSGLLDYVTAWYIKAAQYIQKTQIKVAFVSTNSISMGEQVGVLWPILFDRYQISIHFAHRTFDWQSEARGSAHVHVVIIGFAAFPARRPLLYDYESIRGEPTINFVTNISPYLVQGPNLTITNRNQPLSSVPQCGIGNQPIDDGHYLFTNDEKEAFIAKEPSSCEFFRRWMGSREFINRQVRWVLWLGDCPPDRLRTMPEVLKRVEAVKRFREQSKRKSTLKLADYPTRFQVENFPESNYLLIPEVSSERRNFIPMGFMNPDVVSSNLVKLVPDATLYHFGVLSSTMHMAWVRAVCGRLESRYRYSAKLVYNNFPWPSEVSKDQIAMVEFRAQVVLDVRAEFPDSTLADLYDPLTMPLSLSKAHSALDKSVDKCYRSQPFKSERQRIEFLFGLYENLSRPLMQSLSKRPRRTKKASNEDELAN